MSIHDEHIAEVKRLAEEIEGYCELNARLSELLEGTVNALRGKPKPNTLHSWHDVPDLAQAVALDAVNLAIALRQLSSVRFCPNGPQAAIDRAAYQAGLALGAHDKLFKELRYETDTGDTDDETQRAGQV